MKQVLGDTCRGDRRICVWHGRRRRREVGCQCGRASANPAHEGRIPHPAIGQHLSGVYLRDKIHFRNRPNRLAIHFEMPVHSTARRANSIHSPTNAKGFRKLFRKPVRNSVGDKEARAHATVPPARRSVRAGAKSKCNQFDDDGSLISSSCLVTVTAGVRSGKDEGRRMNDEELPEAPWRAVIMPLHSVVL